MKYLKFYNIQTCNLFIYNNATVSWFCFYFTNAQNFDNAEGTKSVKCGSKLALDQKKSGNFALPLMSYYKMCCGRLFDHEVHHCSLFLYLFVKGTILKVT
jgi:hypothetical protein